MDEGSQFLAPFDLESSLQIPPSLEAEKFSLQSNNQAYSNSENIFIEEKAKISCYNFNHENRFSKPIYQMLERIDNKLKAEEHQRKFGFDEILKDFQPSTDSYNQEEHLWVDKYRPKKFTQLISMDSSNLEVLKWIKQWDFVKNRFSGDSSLNMTSGNIPHQVPRKPSNTANNKLSSGSNEIYDPFGRPDKKILLIHGHPGLGKTTLAHIVAQTAGYSVVEINASDERSGNLVINKISSALQVKSAFTKDLKPNMIVIDEIDGAAAAGNENSLIKYLVKIATAKTVKKSKFKGVSLSFESESDSDDNNTEENKSTSLKLSKNKAVSNCGLIRPIICICNDLFVPALRPLRQIAHIVQIKPLSPVQLSLRLKSICDTEGLKINTRSLVDLSEIMDSDVRSSLNALQFLHRKQGSAHNMNSFTNDLTFGAFKDSVKPPMKLYENVFHSSSTSNTIKKAIMVKDSNNSNRKYSHLLEMLWTSGVETDRIINGCFEIYPTVKFFDNCTMDRVNSGLEIFSQFDLMSNPRNISSGSSSVEGRLDAYSLYSAAGLKDVFSTPVYTQIKYPKADYENHLKKSEHAAILKDYMSVLPNQIRSTSSKDSLIFERINTVIISALGQFNSIKASNPQLMKIDEKNKLNRSVEILHEEGIFLKQIKLADGTSYKFVLDPPIDKLCLNLNSNLNDSKFDYFDFSNTEKVQDSHSYALCRLTASEMESLRIKNMKQKTLVTVQSSQPPLSSSTESIGMKRHISTPSTLEIKDTSKDFNKRCARDFFGRPVTISEDKENSSTGQHHNFNSSHGIKSVEMNIWYVQNDGVSNAVRRNIKVGSFSSFH